MIEPTPILLDEQPDGTWLIHCPDCSWHRTFAREQNAITRLSEHSLVKHKIRRIWQNAMPLRAATDD